MASDHVPLSKYSLYQCLLFVLTSLPNPSDSVKIHPGANAKQRQSCRLALSRTVITTAAHVFKQMAQSPCDLQGWVAKWRVFPVGKADSPHMAHKSPDVTSQIPRVGQMAGTGKSRHFQREIFNVMIFTLHLVYPF